MKMDLQAMALGALTALVVGSGSMVGCASVDDGPVATASQPLTFGNIDAADQRGNETSVAVLPTGGFNDGFETGDLMGWVASGASETVVSSDHHSGSFAAMLGSTQPTNGDSTISQTFTAPAVSPVDLHFWWKMFCNDVCGTNCDFATATLKDNTAGGTVTTILPRTCTTNSWTQVDAPLVSGHEYVLKLVNHDDNWPGDGDDTLFDDVSLSSPASTVIAFNTASHNNKYAAWTFSTDGVAFTTRDETSNPFFTGTPPTLTDGTQYVGTAGDPALVPTGWPNQLAYFEPAVSTASQNSATTSDIVMFLSRDGGQTFGPNGNLPGGGLCGPQCFAMVSDSNSDGAAGAQPGFADQPTASLEWDGVQPAGPNQPHVVWVNWRNRNSSLSQGLSRNWIRRLHFESDGTIDSSGSPPPREIRIDCNLSCVAFSDANIAAACTDPMAAQIDDCGNGSSERLLVTFPRANADSTDLESDQLDDCPTNPTFDLELRAAVSSDWGEHWRKSVGGDDGSVILDTDSAWPSCVDPDANGHHGNNRARPAVVYDAETSSWHVFWNRTLFQTDPDTHQQTSRGQRVFYTTSDVSISTGFAPVFEVAPTITLWGQPQPCFSNGTECVSNQFAASAAWMWQPTQPTVTVAWHDTRRSPGPPALQSIFGRAIVNGSWNGIEELAAQIADGDLIPWSTIDPTEGSGTGNTPWGDYEGMTCAPSVGCFPAWGDTRDEQSNSSIYATLWKPQ